MIYFDNSATTYPKPKSVLNTLKQAYTDYAFNTGRSGYKAAMRASKKVYGVREKIGSMFGFSTEGVAFTKNCTEALNTAIKGIVEQGDHFIISSLEHNSVFRVLYQLQQQDMITFDIAPYSFDDEETVRAFESRIQPNTKAIICTHSSNVFGVSLPIQRLGALCRKHQILFLLDAAQGAGAAKINAVTDHIDIMCAAGHKSLLGPMGTGFIAVSDGVTIRPLTEGGTGNQSLLPEMPPYLPERLEAGTLNVPGILGLGAGLDFIERCSVEGIQRKEHSLLITLYDALRRIPQARLYTPSPHEYSGVAVLSMNVKGYSSEAVALALSKENICVRGGYHCAPLAHRHFGTLESGTVRVSLGFFNTEEEIDKFVNVVKKL